MCIVLVTKENEILVIVQKECKTLAMCYRKNKEIAKQTKTTAFLKRKLSGECNFFSLRFLRFLLYLLLFFKFFLQQSLLLSKLNIGIKIFANL